ncbi:bifunctional arginine demethylase and lysyl-hydroxylase JMJD6 [Thecamonas trahens ATCC 50062]|uniref:Bifunctional arginine demethylase and lysyl-hydroxylase JMJD6 n=1 Tax=Thecamonas trahens ATCC 50062 TaxID=461836 RepID=A0A0L0DWM6_THETB|nr:bifunctional arginine demethylase and lysyl-hydroxylase JMJD6 [Thecamonas trahens ATCC 50062]KNC55938.1 bifunctional arginine demethylase and lysyl-hydroxylase JMJD6 [Thecamonas trahens ATCC 50062]|eukprot:XP_013752710.1 bifunctional arginine demethylase and lysyl-hydroxylase JMJD6 [Thecamonas trahens ATCC 50062]
MSACESTIVNSTEELLAEVEVEQAESREDFELRVRKIKKRVNPDVSSRKWGVKRHADVPEEVLRGSGELDHLLPRFDARTMTEAEWFAFEALDRPCVIENLMDDWKAPAKWTPRRFMRKYADKTFDVGSFNYTDMTWAQFVRYALTNDDDSPLYVFDPYYGSKYPKLLQQYTVPRFFRDDYHQYAGEKDRPLYRWFLVGPKRSGTGIHQDPGNTSAWNALVMGQKRWAFFPPSTKGSVVKPPKGAGDEGIDWWLDVYPQLRPRAEELGMIEYTQKAGETLFVPWKWWHVVLNTEFTVSVTQNFASRVNMPHVWRYTKKYRPKYGRRWYFKLPPEVRDALDVSDFDLTGPVEGSDSSSSSSSSSSEASWDGD